ncbi:hypothetical protein Dhaf_1336 [Desulfitobacterium hafniense DCB-2]|uniref:Uncharacterized protein n=1 Tax=Desulfitobacterium hafniense (strain DSM 10664 / DCB-2) TaxID=272564 RepID=B8G274_DESHD|nr:hypothetical protein [Desulfitobacterium hafniense]ACL19392.1 hypothetical protein Dhaf_1336 [Desulfitobacterium hafniense DCB-2]
MNSQKLTPDPVYQAILQTHTDSLKRYLSLAPALRTPSQGNKSGANPANQYYQNLQSQAKSFEEG